MIDMTMSNHDRLHAKLVALQNGDNLADVVTRIDHDRFARLLIAEDRAIALQRSHRQNFVDHNTDCNGGTVRGSFLGGVRLSHPL